MTFNFLKNWFRKQPAPAPTHSNLSADAETHLTRARTLLSEGQFQAALHEIDRVITLAPHHPEPHILAGYARLHLGQFAEAESSITRALEFPVSSAHPYRIRARAREALGRWQEALRDCNTAIEIEPKQGESLQQRIRILYALQRFDEAYAAATELVRAAPERVSPYWMRANVELGRGNPRGALTDLNFLLEKSANLSLDGDVLSSFEERRALPPGKGHRLLMPDRCGLLISRAQAHIALENHAAAFQDLDAAHKADPASLLPLEVRAALHLQRDEFEQAIDLHDQLIDLMPCAQTYLARSQVLLHASRIEAALDDIEYAAQISDKPTEVRGHLGQILLQLGRIDEAREVFDAIVHDQPNDPRPLFLRAQCWRHLGLHHNQVEDLERARQIEPEAVIVLNSLAWVLATGPHELRDGPRAVKIARQAESLTQGTDPDILDTLAAALAEDGQFEQAAEVQRRAIARFKQSPIPVDIEKYRARLAQYEMGLALHE